MKDIGKAKIGKGRPRNATVRNPILKQAKTTAKIKVRLDARTVITIKDMSAFKIWKDKYPNATIMVD